jgi:endonuclease YncB( thermonuclease family)
MSPDRGGDGFLVGRSVRVFPVLYPHRGFMRRYALVLLLLLPVPAAAAPVGLSDGGSAEVASVVDGDTLVLKDGSQVRLVGIQAPKLPLGRPNFPAWPLAEDAKAALERLVDGKSVDMRYGGARRDRHGRHLAQLYTPDGTWVQGALLEAGFARVYSFPDNRAVVADMLALEAQARAHRRGIWADPFYRVLTPEEAARHLDTFQLVEGKVQGVSTVRGRVYLNFGADWRTDFTVAIDPADMRAFREAGFDPRAWEGRRVRVRGWLKSMNGPMIQATHPEQIEILPP